MALPVRIFTPGPESEKDVHTEHCCEIHGCKYGHDNCPVVNWRKKQSYACESCQEDAEGFEYSGDEPTGLVFDEHPYCGFPIGEKK